MDLVKLLNEADGGTGLAALAQNFGISESEARSVVANVLPQVAERIERNTLSRGGVADLVAMMGSVGAHGVGRPELVGTDAGRQQGEALLEQLFGTRDKSRAVAAKASYASGIGEGVIKMMLPFIVSMVMNAIFKRTSGSLGDILNKIPNMGGGNDGGGRSPPPRGGGGLDDIFSRIPNIGGDAPPSSPGTARRENEIGGPRSGGAENGGFETGGRMGDRSGFPDAGSRPSASFPGGAQSLPIPGDLGRGGWGTGNAGHTSAPSNPYGDLSDIIRRGGGAPGAEAAGEGVLWRMIRGVIGSVLGFQNRGVLSWILRLVVLKFGGTILRTILRRSFGGR